ncbi:MAG: anti-sigma factor antagonist [Candidatus Krumholzibacteriota bacterium]|nr:anti-sigma factor antagonist [Candidatus Krumholzibacteriota bacterium]
MKKKNLKKEKNFHLEFHADENNLGDIRDYISNICLQAGFSKREINNTKLAVDEACTNIIKHAYVGKSGKIIVDIRAWPGNVEIHLRDRGKPFNWSGVEDPDLEEYVEMGKRGGLGIYLMNRLMDHIRYESSSGGNHLIMSKSSEAFQQDKRSRLVSLKPRWTQTLRFKFLLRASAGFSVLIAVIGILQFISQTRELENNRQKAWMQIRNFARTLELRSENALVLDDLYHPEYRKLNEFIHDGMKSHPEIEAMRVVNKEGVIVSSSVADEFGQPIENLPGAGDFSSYGKWVSMKKNEENIKAYHLPVILSEKNDDKRINLGYLVMEVSARKIERGIQDQRYKLIVILLGIFVAGIGLIYLLVSIFIKPIQTLTDGVLAIGEGSLEDELDIKGPKEIGAIAKAFNDITAKFRVAQESVVEKERMQKEMQVAQEIQHSLLPRKVPEIGGYDIASYYKAAKEVGGDYYDFVNVDEDTVGVVVADVSGKGVPGSLVMTMIRTALRMEARGNRLAADVMAKMNEFVTDDMKKGMFVTIFYVILDSRNRVISYASAGHNPMILYRASTNETFYLNPRGFPVGINLPDDKLFRKSIDVEKIKLKKDDMLLIYTDGVTEAMNVNREQYGEKRLLKLMKESGGKSPQEFLDSLSEDIDRFTGEYPQNDDITVVAFKEKYVADEVLSGIRKKLLDLVSVEGISVAEACRKMKVSPSTYYRYKKRLELLGERGLKNKNLREDQDLRRFSNEQRAKLMEIVKQDPKFGPKRIADRFNEGKAEENKITSSLVYEELKRMRLNTYEKRAEYLKRSGIIFEGEREVESKDIDKAKRETAGIEEEKSESYVSPDQKETADKLPVASKTDSGEAFKPGVTETVEGKTSREIEYQENIEEMEYGTDSVVNIEDEKYNEDITILKVSGHLDSSSTGELENIMENLFEEGATNIIVDLKDVTYISSGGWGVFVGRVKNLREKKGDVVLVGMSREVYDIFELLGFMDIIMQFRLKEDALDYLSLPFKERQKHLKVKQKKYRKKNPEKTPISEGLDIEHADMIPLSIKAGSVGESGEITVLELNGIIDTVSSVKLSDIFERVLQTGSIKIVADMSGVEYISSAGWGVFASRVEGLRRKGGDLKIFGMDSELNRVFTMLGFDDLMRSFNVMAEAVEDFDVEIAAAGYDENDLESEPAVVAADHSNTGAEGYSFGVNLERVKDSGSEGVILEVEGAIDASSNDEFNRSLEESLAGDPDFLIVDLSNAVYINSSGWGNIARYAQQRMKSDGMKLALSGMNSAIFNIFTDLGFEDLIPHFTNTERAVEELRVTEGVGASSNNRNKGADEEEISEEITQNKVDHTDGIESSREEEKEKREKEIIYSSNIQKDGYIESDTAKQEDENSYLKDLSEKEETTSGSDIDVEKEKIDRLEDKDSKIRNIGWDAYGKKLSKKNKKGDKGTDK